MCNYKTQYLRELHLSDTRCCVSKDRNNKWLVKRFVEIRLQPAKKSYLQL
mgnify:CR=1 FL=1